jgi:hypothetical protein
VRRHADDFVNGRFGEYLESLRLILVFPGFAAAVVAGTVSCGTKGLATRMSIGRLPSALTRPCISTGSRIFTASLVMRCVEEGRLSLDDRMGRFKATSDSKPR